MIIILGIIGYFIIGLIVGIIICKIKGKEWCRAYTDGLGFLENNAEFILFFSTCLWVLFILFSPLFVIYYFITYIAQKLQG